MNDKLIRLKNVRISFPYLMEKSVYQDSEPKYKAHFIITKDSPEDKAIRARIEEEAKAKWGPKAPTILKSIVGNNMKYVSQPGENKDYPENTMYLSASSDRKPRVFNKDKREATPENCDIYSGCYVDAIVTVYATKSQGIAAGLSGVMFVADGESFGGGYVASAEDFGISYEDDPLGA